MAEKVKALMGEVPCVVMMWRDFIGRIGWEAIGAKAWRVVSMDRNAAAASRSYGGLMDIARN